jgi:hypothetical protein
MPFYTPDTSNIDVYLPTLNISVTALEALFPGFEQAINFKYNVDISLNCFDSSLNAAFQFHTNNIDSMWDPSYGNFNFSSDFSYNDLRFTYKYQDHSFSSFIDSVVTTSPGDNGGKITTEVGGNALSYLSPSSRKTTMGDEYTSYLAYNLFRTVKGLELLGNVDEVAVTLDYNADENLEAKLKVLCDDFSKNQVFVDDLHTGYDINKIHPSQLILQAIMKKDPERINTMNIDPSDGTYWYNNLLVEGDKLIFTLTVSPATGQENLNAVLPDTTIGSSPASAGASYTTNSVAKFTDRVYKITAHVLSSPNEYNIIDKVRYNNYHPGDPIP